MLVETEILEQDRLPGFDRSLGYKEKVMLGSSALTVLHDVLGRNSEFSRISCVVYPAYGLSDEATDNSQQIWVEVNSVTRSRLQSVSDRYKPEDEVIGNPELGTVTWALGVCSNVAMKNGTQLHVPMMDFSCGEGDVQEAVKALGESSGYVLSSGGSYHFWGHRMLDDVKWRAFLNSCRNANMVSGENLFDEGYIDISQKRGFSALRIFAYPLEKPVEPFVVGVTGGFKI